MGYLLYSVHRDDSSDVPVYEEPPSMYTAETIIKVLLNPSSRICRKCPIGVCKSATYAIDVTTLSHPDDVKKDDFGRWNHKGSHPIPFTCGSDMMGLLVSNAVQMELKVKMCTGYDDCTVHTLPILTSRDCLPF